MTFVSEKKQSNSPVGFTLVEILVVIAVIALLLSVFMPALGKAKSTARRLLCASNLRQIYLAMSCYLRDHDETYPCAEDPLPPGYWLWMGRGFRPFIEPYLGIVDSENHSLILLCPADRTDPNKYDNTSYAYSMCFYHSPAQINGMDSTRDQWDNTLAEPSLPQKSFSVAHPSAKVLIGEWGSHHLLLDDKDPGWWGDIGRRNYLFADGHIGYIEAEKIRRAGDGNPNPNLTVNGIKGWDWPK